MYKNQLLFILLEMLPGSVPNINIKNKMDDYCKSIHKTLSKADDCQKYIQDAIEQFIGLKNIWISEKGTRYEFGIKDSEEFTNFVLRKLHSNPTENTVENVGQIINVQYDIHNRLYCFIEREPDNIFAHSFKNSDVDFSKLQPGQLVTYKVEKNYNDNLQAVSMKLIDNN